MRNTATLFGNFKPGGQFVLAGQPRLRVGLIMFTLVYMSSEAIRFSDPELADLLTVSRQKNLLRDITGMLLYKDGNFMQLLEGPEEAVRTTFLKIKTDSRHRSVRILMEEETSEREFSAWSMGFRKLDGNTAVDVAGYSDYLDVPLTGEELLSDPTKALRFLLIFKKSVL